MPRILHTVVETMEFARRVPALLTAEQRQALIDHLAARPDAGDPIVGTGGARKLRWAAKGHGKSGGVRVITFFSGPRIPVFLLTLFGKNEKANLSAAERNELKSILIEIVAEYRRGSSEYVQGRRKHPARRS